MDTWYEDVCITRSSIGGACVNVLGKCSEMHVR